MSENAGVVSELIALQSAGVLDAKQVQSISERYPVGRWNVVTLVRWFTILGALCAGAGAVILATELVNALRLGEAGLALACGLLIFFARVVTARGLARTAAAMELGAGFALQGFTTALAVDFSTGSDNWPALIGVQAMLLLGLAYALNNRLVLIHATVCLFIWFGGETGYISGWGAYYLGMTYPVRFLAAALAALGVAYVHFRFIPRFQHFSRVWAHFGTLIGHLSLWFLSVFGYFEETVRWSGNEAERVAFSAVWAGVSVACMLGGAKLGQQMLRGYGLVFLIINVYTFYFQFVVANSGELWFFHLLLVGGSMVGVGFWLERKLRPRAVPTSADPPKPAAQPADGG
jgi:hypothetical protein